MEIVLGDRIRALDDVEVTALTVWRAPLHTGGHRAVLPAGTVLVTFTPVPGAEGVGCYPEEYDALEATLIPPETRLEPEYHAYYVIVAFDEILAEFERIAPLDPRPSENRLPR